jgi:periplasmic divalent cation tolerance protein
MIIVYVTVENEKRAKELASHLLEKKLCACANIFPIISMYLWPPQSGQVEEGGETAVLIKTLEDKLKEIKSFIEKWHSYEVPLFFSIRPFSVNEKFENWLKAELS